MKRVILYEYNTFDLGCGCCSDSFSAYDVFEDGVLVVDERSCHVLENEEQLREYLAHLEPFDVHPDTKYF